MPERYVHKKLSELLFGDSCEATHAAIDEPVKELGRGHRKLYHDPISAGLIGLVEDGYKGALSSTVHIITDNCTSNPIYKEALKLSLEILGRAKKEIEKIEKEKAGSEEKIKN